MKSLKINILNVLNNENGGPNVEQVIGIAVALAVGSGLFLFGSTVFNWFNKDASDSVSQISTPPEDAWNMDVSK